MISKAVFAGTFDPFTLGHFEIAERAAKRFDEVIVAVADVTGKTCMFRSKNAWNSQKSRFLRSKT